MRGVGAPHLIRPRGVVPARARSRFGGPGRRRRQRVMRRDEARHPLCRRRRARDVDAKVLVLKHRSKMSLFTDPRALTNTSRPFPSPAIQAWHPQALATNSVGLVARAASIRPAGFAEADAAALRHDALTTVPSRFDFWRL